MKKRALRLILGAGYVILLTLLLLYQAGILGDRRDWRVVMLATLLLGVSLAVVLALYLHVNDRIRRQGQNGDSPAGTVLAAEGEQAGADQAAGQAQREREADGQEKTAEAKGFLANRSYEEIYAAFLAAMKGRTVSERELEVAWLLYRGYTNRQIGEELYIAETTVKKHVSHIYQKLAVYSRKEFRAYVQEAVVPAATAQTDPPA